MTQVAKTMKLDKTLYFTPYAWAKLQFMCHVGKTEVGGFGITDVNDPLLVVDFHLVEQESTAMTVEFTDDGMAFYHLAMSKLGIPMERCGRIWIHTHPGCSPHPSGTDENTWNHKFQEVDTMCMFILAREGKTYTRIRVRHDILGHIDAEIDAGVDWFTDFEASAIADWHKEYKEKVSEGSFSYGKKQTGFVPTHSQSSAVLGNGFPGYGIPEKYSLMDSEKKETNGQSIGTRCLTSEEAESLWKQANKEQAFGRQDQLLDEEIAEKSFNILTNAMDLGLYNIETGWAAVGNSLRHLAMMSSVDAPHQGLLNSDDEDLVEWWAHKSGIQIPPRNTWQWGEMWEDFWNCLRGGSKKKKQKMSKTQKEESISTASLK